MNDEYDQYAPENRPKSSTDVQALLLELKKKHKGGILTTAGQLDLPNEPMSTGILAVDCVLGGGLFPRKTYEFLGPESSGKTICLYNAIASVQRQGYIPALYDAERSSETKEWLEFNGVDIDNLIYIVGTAEEAMQKLLDCVKNPKVGLAAIDSIASMVTAQALESELEKAQVGGVAKLLGAFLGLYNIHSVRAPLFLINQVRESIGTYSPFGDAMHSSGGRARRHWASSRLEVRGNRKELTEGKGIEQTIKGLDVYVKAIKNRLGVEGSRSYFRFIFDQGIDEPEMVLRLAKVSGLLKQGGAWVKGTIMGEDVTFQGLEGFRVLLKARPEFDPWLRARILENYKKHTYVTKEEGELPDAQG